MSERIVNGNKVYLDDVRGRWTVLFTATNTRNQYGTETEALAAASATKGLVSTESDRGVVPKQAADNALTKKSVAVSELDNQVKESITQTVASEGSVLNTSVGNEKDGFTSLTASTTKGSANEGPAVAVMGGNIKEGNVTKNVSSTSKLSSVTGGSKGKSAVLNETVVQASPKGISKALTTTVGLNSTQVQNAISESSPIPSQAKAAVKSEVESGGPAKTAAVNVVKASAKVSKENGNSFGSVNPFGPIGSAFGNILGQIVAEAFGAGSYKNPISELKVSGATSVIDRAGNYIPTPNIVNFDGTTNLTKALTKSKLENPRIKTLPNTVRPGQRSTGYNGIITKLKGYNYGEYGLGDEQRALAAGVSEGGSYLIPILNNPQELSAEFTAIERDITTLIIRHTVIGVKTRYEAEDVHVGWRKASVKAFGAAAVNNSPFDYVFPAHLFVDEVASLKIITPFQYELPINNGEKEYVPNSIYIFLEGSAQPINRINPEQLKVLEAVVKTFLKVFPGGEVLGLNDVSDKERYRNVPYFDVREYTKSKLRKPSVTQSNEKAVVPPPADLADAKPQGVVLPKKSPNARPNLSAIAVTQNKIANPPTNINVGNYSSSQLQALQTIKDRKNAVKIADLSTGSGLTSSLSSVANLNAGTSLSTSLLNSIASGLGPSPIGKIGLNIAGSVIGKIARTDTTSNSLLNDTQSFKIEQLKLGKVFDSITGVFK